jgi:outer membrane protein TolC
MKMKNFFQPFFIAFLQIMVVFCISTTAIQAQDTTRSLNAEQVVYLVKKFHPIVRQTQINIEQSNADILIARSAFDPGLSHQMNAKTFDGTNYYNQITPEIKIPTWYGIEVAAGLED